MSKVTSEKWMKDRADDIIGWKVVALTRCGQEVRLLPMDYENPEGMPLGVFPTREDAGYWIEDLRNKTFVQIGRSRWIRTDDIAHIVVRPKFKAQDTEDDDDE